MYDYIPELQPLCVNVCMVVREQPSIYSGAKACLHNHTVVLTPTVYIAYQYITCTVVPIRFSLYSLEVQFGSR